MGAVSYFEDQAKDIFSNETKTLVAQESSQSAPVFLEPPPLWRHVPAD